MARRVQKATEPDPARKRRLLMFGCGGLLVLAVLISLILYVKATGRADLPREVRQRLAQEAKGGPRPAGGTGVGSGLGPTVSTVIPAGTPPLRQQVDSLRASLQTGTDAPLTLYVRDSELNDLISSSGEHPAQIEGASTYFDRDKAFVTATVRYRGRPWNVTLTTRPVIVNGGVQFVVEDVKLGSLTAPPGIVDMVQAEVNKNRDRFDPTKTGVYVENIQLTPGVAILTGRPYRH
jgi:hypothetical protein